MSSISHTIRPTPNVLNKQLYNAFLELYLFVHSSACKPIQACVSSSSAVFIHVWVSFIWSTKSELSLARSNSLIDFCNSSTESLMSARQYRLAATFFRFRPWIFDMSRAFLAYIWWIQALYWVRYELIIQDWNWLSCHALTRISDTT